MQTAHFRTGQSSKLMLQLLALLLVASWCHSSEAQGQRSRKPDKAPKVGQKAPDFTLKSLDGKSKTKLSNFRGKKPVVLFFGSYT